MTIINKRSRSGVIGLSDDAIRYEICHHENRSIAVLILPSHPDANGSMYDKVVEQVFMECNANKYTAMRISFVGAKGAANQYDRYIAQAAIALEELKNEISYGTTNMSVQYWIVGYSFGALIATNLLLRRPEISGFVSIAPALPFFDYVSWLTPCPTKGMVIYATRDEYVPMEKSEEYISLLKTRRMTITSCPIFGVGHLFQKKQMQVARECVNFIRENEFASNDYQNVLNSSSILSTEDSD
jgi:alpha/beta superfamily hydrolase